MSDISMKSCALTNTDVFFVFFSFIISSSIQSIEHPGWEHCQLRLRVHSKAKHFISKTPDFAKGARLRQRRSWERESDQQSGERDRGVRNWEFLRRSHSTSSKDSRQQTVSSRFLQWFTLAYWKIWAQQPATLSNWPTWVMNNTSSCSTSEAKWRKSNPYSALSFQVKTKNW